jgi:hypothetical protein
VPKQTHVLVAGDSGDPWRGTFVPGIRIQGKRLGLTGFRPGDESRVTSRRSGWLVIQRK